jgi:predicted RNA-binding protein with PIN domain
MGEEHDMNAKELLFVDGYNILNAWPELMELKDLEHARDKFINILAGYGAYKNYRIIIVFDAHSVPGPDSSEKVFDDVEVVFTGEGETADSYIEKSTYLAVRTGRSVFVATSDWAEQTVILGAGAYRLSARELIQDIKGIDKLMKEKFTETPVNYRRHELGSRINSTVMERLNEIRKGR